MNSKASDVSEGVAVAKAEWFCDGCRKVFTRPLSRCPVCWRGPLREALDDHDATLSPPLPSLEVERRALKLLARHTCFSAYSAAEPLCIHFDFGSEADRIAAANALDEAFAAPPRWRIVQ